MYVFVFIKWLIDGWIIITSLFISLFISRKESVHIHYYLSGYDTLTLTHLRPGQWPYNLEVKNKHHFVFTLTHLWPWSWSYYLVKKGHAALWFLHYSDSFHWNSHILSFDRLAEQLAGWMYRHEEEKKKVVKKQEKRQKDKQLRPISTLRRAMRGELQHDGNRKAQRWVTDTHINIQPPVKDRVIPKTL